MKKLAVIAAVGLASLAGCANSSPSVAAYVGGTPIPQSQVDAVSRAIVDAGSADSTSVARNVVIQISIQNELAKRAAAEANISVTDAQRQQLITQNAGLQPLLKNPATAQFTQDYLNTVVIFNDKAGQAAAKKVAAETSIRVNPVYGTWDSTQLALVEGSTGSISELAPAKE